MHGPHTLDMSLEEAMSTQRAIRRLKPDPVDDALVLHLIELALKAPTGSNAQNWEFIVVRDPVVKGKLARLNRGAWRLYGGLGRRLVERRGDEGMRKILNAVQWQADHFEEIPVIIVACIKGVIPAWPPVATASIYGSIFPSVQNLLLAARAEGLGTALTTLLCAVEPQVKALLAIPDGIATAALVPMGYPAKPFPKRLARKPLEESVYGDGWGAPLAG